MNNLKYEGTLEIHPDRGVIYFHNQSHVTILRICSLPPIPKEKGRQLDITHMFGTNWGPVTESERNDHGRTGYALEKSLLTKSTGQALAEAKAREPKDG